MRLGLSQKLLGSEIAESLVGADGVVSPFPGTQLLVELGDLERAGGDLIELLRVSTVGAGDVVGQVGLRNDREYQDRIVDRG